MNTVEKKFLMSCLRKFRRFSLKPLTKIIWVNYQFDMNVSDIGSHRIFCNLYRAFRTFFKICRVIRRELTFAHVHLAKKAIGR